MMFAAVFTLSLIGVVASLVFRYLQSKIVFWEGEQSDSNVVIP
jgi:ABC-type nitrate/sulfonate/bicarbonate transport system permease component